MAEPQTRVGAVRVRALSNESEENVSWLEDSCIVSKQAKYETDEKTLKVVSNVAGGFQGIMELAHHLQRFEIYRVLVTKRSFLNAQNETKSFDMVGKLIECKTKRGIVFEVEQLEGLEVTDQYVPGEFVFLQSSLRQLHRAERRRVLPPHVRAGP